jgi:hypothetical protein
VQQLVEICFLEFQFNRVYLHVLKANQAAIALYRSIGFRSCDPVLPRPKSIQTMVLIRTNGNPEGFRERARRTDIEK